MNKAIMKNIFFTCIAFGLIAALLLNQWGGASPQPATAQAFDRRAMLENITLEVILPSHAAFVAQADLLREAAYTFQATPSPDTLAAFRDQWRVTALAWERCEVFRFRRLMAFHTAIEKRPIDIERIEGAIAGDAPIDEASIESSGSTSKGLAALEYLLFAAETGSDTQFNMLTSDPRRLAYAVALAENIAVKGAALYEQWSPEGENYAEIFINADGEGTALRESLSMMTNQMVTLLETLLQMKLGVPLGQDAGGTPQPEQVEGYLSGEALAHIVANLEGLQATFTGGQGQGLDDYLTFLGVAYDGQPLANMINSQFEEVFAALAAIDLPLERAVVEQPEQVQAAYDAIYDLLILIRVDMAGQLGVIITFSDNDGD